MDAAEKNAKIEEHIVEVRTRRRDFNDSTLFNLAANSIVKNQAYFCYLAHNTGRNPFDYIPNILRAKLVHRNFYDLSDEFATENGQLLTLLLNKEVNSVFLVNIPRVDKHAMKSVTDLWFAITKKCPHLQTLVCRDFISKEKLGLSAFFSFTLNFSELRNLDMPNMSFNKLRLSILAQYLPQLQVLRVALARSVSSEAIATLANLEHLQEFLYFRKNVDNKLPTTRNKDLYSMCLQLLPRLHISCTRIKIEQAYDFCHVEFSWNSFQELQGRLPNLLGLRQLALNNASEMPVRVVLPDLTKLCLIMPQEDFRLGCEFSRLSELGLIGLKQQLLMNIINEVGNQLLKLSVFVDDFLEVDTVFQLCPKLQTFCIFGFPTNFLGLAAPDNDFILSSLTELRLVMQNDGNWNSCLQQNHLLLILRALPSLRVLRLKNIIFDQHDVLHLGGALKRSEVLQNLETFSCCYKWLDDHVEARMHDHLETSHAFFCHVLNNCPKLCNVKVRSWQ